MPQVASWAGTPSIKGSSESMRMALLTFSLIGLQFTWGIEMTYCTPYLVQLGLTKSRTSMVWIAGPLSGLVVQPLVGVLADRSRSRFGRRRPFMIVGSIIVVCSLLILGWAKELVALVHGHPETQAVWTVVVAIGSIYAVDFAINAVQSSCRSLIVDTLPIEKQQLGSAWAGRMVAVGHLVGYAAGTLNLVGTFGTFWGDTQFKQLILLAAAVLVFAVGVTSWAVHERVLVSAKEGDSAAGVMEVVKKIWRTTLHLPPRIQAICWVQFWAWIAWFPFLFYGPTWVGEIYSQYSLNTAAAAAAPSSDKLGEIGRIGSLSLVIFSLVTLASSLIIPILVRSPAEAHKKFTPRPPPLLATLLTTLHALTPDLLTAWLLSHLLFAASMALTPFVRSLAFATTLISIAGLPWALASWAPFAFIGVEINRLANGTTYRHLNRPGDHPDHPDNDDNSDHALATPMLHLNHLACDRDGDQAANTDNDNGDDDDDEYSASTGMHASTGETAGIYLGILNLFTALPQFVGTFISMLVFDLIEPDPSKESADGAVTTATTASMENMAYTGVNAISVCLFIGALSSCGAAYATWRLKFVR